MIFSDVDFLNADLELDFEFCLLWPCTMDLILSERWMEASPSLRGRWDIFSYYNKIYCFLFDILTPLCFDEFEDLSFSGGKISPSKYSIYFLESYSYKPIECSEELCSHLISRLRSSSSYFFSCSTSSTLCSLRPLFAKMVFALISRSFLFISDCWVSFSNNS